MLETIHIPEEDLQFRILQNPVPKPLYSNATILEYSNVPAYLHANASHSHLANANDSHSHLDFCPRHRPDPTPF